MCILMSAKVGSSMNEKCMLVEQLDCSPKTLLPSLDQKNPTIIKPAPLQPDLKQYKMYVHTLPIPPYRA